MAFQPSSSSHTPTSPETYHDDSNEKTAASSMHTSASVSPKASHNDNNEKTTMTTASVEQNATPDNESTILTGRKLALVYMAMLLSLLVMALDSTILATPLPRIASEFNAFSLQGWIATSFVLAQTIFVPFYGQLLGIYPPKWVLVGCIVIFEIGSIVCAVAQDVNTLIAGRAVTGFGAAGIWISILQILAQISHLDKRALLLGGFQFVFGFASVAGPLVGGAFTDHITWRWCFWINLPIGGLSMATLILFLKTSPPLGADLNNRSTKELLRQTLRIDLGGTALVAGFVTCLILALQWGGNTKPWGDKDVIICFVLSGVFVIALVFWELYQSERAIIPLGLFRSRSSIALVMWCGLDNFVLLLFSYYIPIYYQAARHSTATQSGINTLPFLLAVILSVAAGSFYISYAGRYWPVLAIAPILIALGSGLLFSITANTQIANVIGYQILTGVGAGLGIQTPFIALQVEFQETPGLMGQIMGIASFWQVFGGTLGLGVAEPIFASQLTKYLRMYAPTVPIAKVTESPTEVFNSLSPDLIPGVIRAYTDALKPVFLVGVPIGAIAMLMTLLIRNLKIDKRKTDTAMAL